MFLLAVLPGILISDRDKTVYAAKNIDNEMIFIPEGEFIAGSDSSTDGKRGVEYGVSEEPRHKVYLKAFYIDKFEVTIGQYREYLKVTQKEWFGDIKLPKEMPLIYAEPERLNRHPANYVAWPDANAYCMWKGKRLPTEYEW